MANSRIKKICNDNLNVLPYHATPKAHMSMTQHIGFLFQMQESAVHGVQYTLHSTEGEFMNVQLL